jgi:uncharacterized protein (TIGR03435 family)
MKRTFILLLALAFAACGKSAGKPATAKKGQPAPEIKIEKMLKGDLKALKGWEDLKGKAVVLEFWGTTCHPCITNIPHMNELVEKFKDKPVVFIQVSKESEAKVEEFLAEHDMKANVAAGAADAFKKFKIFGIPHAALIDKNGVFQGGLHPGRLKEDTIEALLAGKEISGAEEQEDEEEVKPGEASADGEKSLAFFSVAPAGKKPNLRYGGTSFQADGMTLDYIIETAMDGTHGVEFTDVPEEVKSRKLKVTARVAMVDGADNERRLMELFASGMNGALPVTIRIARKEKKVWLLKRNGALKPGLAKTENFGGRSMSKDGKGATMEASGADLADLANELEDWLDAPVLDETGLTGNYKYKVEVKELTAKAVNAELAEKLGLKLVEARREVEIAEVRGVKNGAKKL